MTRSPGVRSSGATKSPTRILGPARSAKMARGRPKSSAEARSTLIAAAYLSWSPCDMLSRATFIPASTKARMRSGLEVEGPSVQTILVRSIRLVRTVWGEARRLPTAPLKLT